MLYRLYVKGSFLCDIFSATAKDAILDFLNGPYRGKMNPIPIGSEVLVVNSLGEQKKFKVHGMEFGQLKIEALD